MRRSAPVWFAAGLLVLLPGFAPAQEGGVPAAPLAQPAPQPPPAPPGTVKAHDTPDDAGGSITIEWTRSPDDGAGRGTVAAYEIWKRTGDTGDWVSIGVASAGQTSYGDPSCADGNDYFYKVAATDGGGKSESAEVGPVRSRPQWFNGRKKWALAIAAILSFFVIFYIEKLKKGGEVFIRKISGIEAVDEAIGRATEMGRPILFIAGSQDLSDIQTVAGITILGRVARSVAQYDAQLEVPTSRALVMTAARETVKEAYLAAGRPDAYNEDRIYYITDDQFGFVAGVNGYMVREKPATCLYLGAFYAESLILAETGNSIGAIQIAGTAQPAQLPFFVAACDYTLIGEEFFAASAYLSGDPQQQGSLKGQDVGKGIAMAFIVVGVVAETFHVLTGAGWLGTVSTFLQQFFTL